MIQLLWKTVWRLLKKLGIKPPYDPATHYKAYAQRKPKLKKTTCTPVFTAALFTIARTWKQLSCPLTDGWMRKL